VGLLLGALAGLQGLQENRSVLYVIGEVLVGWSLVAAALIALERRLPIRIVLVIGAIFGAWIVSSFAHSPYPSVEYVASSLQGFHDPLLGFLLLAYPTGRLGSPVARLVVGTWLVAHASMVGARFALERPLDWYGCLDCPGVIDAYIADRTLLDQLGTGYESARVVAASLVVAILLLRFGRASPPARRRMAPVVVAGVALAAGIAVIEVAFGVWGSLLQGDVGSLVASALPVLRILVAVSILVAVLRARLARASVADLAIELQRGVPIGGLRDVLARALGDPTAQILFSTGHGAYVDVDGRPATLPPATSARAATRLGSDERAPVLVHDPALSLDGGDLVAAVGSVARLALDNERLSAEVRAQLDEVRASRARILEAGDAERRRVERDLHDGAQQRLVALALRLHMARDATSSDDGGVTELLDKASAELEGALGELRELARGIHPALLTEAGLGPAVGALAERAPVPVAIHVPSGRYDRMTEATAYFVIAEALTNVARHAFATRVSVSAIRTDQELVVVVHDDGIGGANRELGTGLRGLADRVAAAGGTLGMESPTGRGTTVRACLPLG